VPSAQPPEVTQSDSIAAVNLVEGAPKSIPQEALQISRRASNPKELASCDPGPIAWPQPPPRGTPLMKVTQGSGVSAFSAVPSAQPPEVTQSDSIAAVNLVEGAPKSIPQEALQISRRASNPKELGSSDPGPIARPQPPPPRGTPPMKVTGSHQQVTESSLNEARATPTAVTESSEQTNLVANYGPQPLSLNAMQGDKSTQGSRLAGQKQAPLIHAQKGIALQSARTAPIQTSTAPPSRIHTPGSDSPGPATVGFETTSKGTQLPVEMATKRPFADRVHEPQTGTNQRTNSSTVQLQPSQENLPLAAQLSKGGRTIEKTATRGETDSPGFTVTVARHTIVDNFPAANNPSASHNKVTIGRIEVRVNNVARPSENRTQSPIRTWAAPDFLEEKYLNRFRIKP
jgi:hypothetical protein